MTTNTNNSSWVSYLSFGYITYFEDNTVVIPEAPVLDDVVQSPPKFYKFPSAAASVDRAMTQMTHMNQSIQQIQANQIKLKPTPSHKPAFDPNQKSPFLEELTSRLQTFRRQQDSTTVVL